MTTRSDDFLDGLQTAYRAVYKLKEDRALTAVKVGVELALEAIDKAIENAVDDKGKRLIMPCSM